jgi:hypothetical protein
VFVSGWCFKEREMTMQCRSTSGVRVFVFAALLCAGLAAYGQDPCGVGTEVQLKGSSSGRIAEIGTESPHAGWYRIVFSWSPGGEWYDPRTWEMTVVGTDTKCGKRPAATKSEPAKPARPVTAPKPAAPAPDPAAQKECMVGSRVQLKGGPTGTIAEIGTESPHVGWYRIVMSWSPGGEWYDPRTWEMTIVGTNVKCGEKPAAAAPPVARPGATPTAPGRPAAPPKVDPDPAGAPGDCPMGFPQGSVTKSSPPTAATFKRVIYDGEAIRINDTISAPKAIGLTFLSFQMEKAYENTLTSTRFGDKRLYDGAPQGETIYPIKTRELMCERVGTQIRRRVADVSRNCFKNRNGNWTCPGRTTKTLERKLIDLE